MAGFPIPPEQRLIRTFTGRAEQPIRTVFIGAAGLAQGQIDLDYLAKLLAAYFLGVSDDELRAAIRIDTMLGQLDLDLRPLLENLIDRAASVGELVFAKGMGVAPLDVALFRDQAIVAARTMVGDLIRGIEAGRFNPLTGERSAGTLDIVREVIADGFDQGRSLEASAKLIRDVIGLDERRAGALAKYSAELEAQGLPEDERVDMVAREGRRKLKSRGLAVSRTESVRAANKSQDMIWESGVADGQIRSDEWEQEWVPSPNACPICQGLRGARAPIGGLFRPPGGDGPPNPHTHCRCGKRLRRPTLDSGR